MQVSSDTYNVAPSAALLTEVNTSGVVRTDTFDTQLNRQVTPLNTSQEKPLIRYKIEKRSPASPIKSTFEQGTASFINPETAQKDLPSVSAPIKTEPSLPAFKRVIFYEVLTDIMHFNHYYPGQLVIFGSCGVDLLYARINENVNDIDILLNDEETANKLIINLNRKLQHIVFAEAFPLKDCSPNMRLVGSHPDNFEASPLSGQLTLFLTGKPWIKIECSVKTTWMKELDFTHDHYVNRIPIYIKAQYGGTLPVLSPNGYLALDIFSLKKNNEKLIVNENNNQKLTGVLNSAVALSKIDKHFITLYCQQTNPSFYDSELFKALNRQFHETIALIRNICPVERLYHCFFSSPYQLKHSPSPEKRALINILSSDKFRHEPAYSFHDLMILLRNDFDLENTAKDGNCFYESLASGLNKNRTAAINFLKTHNFLRGISLHNPANKNMVISSEMIRYTVHHWIACAYTAGLSASEYEELNTLILPESGKTINDLLENRTIANPAGNPNDTAHYGWSSLLHIVAIITGTTIILLKVNPKEQNIEKHKHSIHEANQLTPNLIKTLKIKQPALFNCAVGDTRLASLLFIAHSGGDHYYAASPSPRLINVFKPYILAERYLMAPAQSEEHQFKQAQHRSGQPPVHQQAITIASSGSPLPPPNKSPDTVEQKTQNHALESPGCLVTGKKKSSEDTVVEPANPTTTKEVDREALIKKKTQIVLAMISNPETCHSLSEDKKHKLGDSLFNEVLKVIQEPGQTDRITVDMRALSDTTLLALETGKQLNHIESILILALYQIIHLSDVNNPMLMTEILRDLRTVNRAKHIKAPVVLTILAARTGSPEAFNLAVQPCTPTYNQQKYHDLSFTLPAEFDALYPDYRTMNPYLIYSVVYFIEKKVFSAPDWQEVDLYFPVDKELNALLTPTLLISDTRESGTSESGTTDITTMRSAMLHCVYKGNISLHRGDTARALTLFLKAAIAYVMATDNGTDISHYEEAAGLSAIYMTIRLIPCIDPQCDLQSEAPFLHSWMPHINLIRHRLETASLKTLLYAIKAQRTTETLWAHSLFTYAYSKTATLLGYALPESFETFKSLLDQEITFLFDHGSPVEEPPPPPCSAGKKSDTIATTALTISNSKEYTLASSANGKQKWQADPVLLAKYKISEKQTPKKQNRKAIENVKILKERVESLSNDFLHLYKDANPNKTRNAANIYTRAIELFDQSIALATQDIPIITREYESGSRDSLKTYVLEKTKMQKAVLMLNTLYGFAALSHIKEDLLFKQELVEKLILFHNTLLSKESIESIAEKHQQKLDKRVAHFIELLDPLQYNDRSEPFLKSMVLILVSCKRLVSNCISDKNVVSIASLIKQWIANCNNEINLMETLELIITLGFSDHEFHTQFNPLIDTILLKIQYLTAKQDDNSDKEDQLILYQSVEKILGKFDSTEQIKFYQSIWTPQCERLYKMTNQEMALKSAEAEKYWDILIREEQENNAREQKKFESIINGKLSTITSEQNNHYTEDDAESDSEESTSVEPHQPPCSVSSDHSGDLNDIASSKTANDSLKMAWQYYGNGQLSKADTIVLGLLKNPPDDSLLIVEIKSLRAEILFKQFFDRVLQGMQRSRGISICSSNYLKKMKSDLCKQKELSKSDKNTRITLQKQQIRNLSDKVFELATSFSTHQHILQDAFTLQKEIINVLQLFAMDGDQETQDLSEIKYDLELIMSEQDRISCFVANIKTASENMIKILDCRRQLLALIREVTARKSISGQSCLPAAGVFASKNRPSGTKSNLDPVPEEALSETEIRRKMKTLAQAMENFQALLLGPQQSSFVQRLIEAP
ncbi:hypothetical protein [Endozoicomonas sp. SCSIO W0465]|uniref:hypothetical protein n=1 Tax=Endozoicomonas sp. SCSIO W0465 TaxID=2918516 RepID=UPI0020750AF1|nr:hypothetical protein [Endozoicomonas sp. SCSIO W0465]USE34905.1 hypothetical protein MJO57_22680 [Endozoicomonas sp. SCSIO W0465]